MADILFPDVKPSSASMTLASNTESFVSPFTGAVQTNDRGGERWRMTLSFSNLCQADRHKIQRFISQMNGQANRAIIPVFDYVSRGALTPSSIVPVIRCLR